MGESIEVDCNCDDYLEHEAYTEIGEVVKCEQCGNRYYNHDDDLVWIDDRKEKIQ